MQNYNNEIKAGKSGNIQLKETALYAIGSLSDLVKQKDELLAQIEQTLYFNVLNEITSDNNVMRFRAMWI